MERALGTLSRAESAFKELRSVENQLLAHAPEKARIRYQKLASRALKWRGPAIKLFCLECMGYSYTDAKACDTTRCPLWAVSKPIFKRKDETSNDHADPIATNAPS